MHLIADLGQVSFLDSTGLGALVGGLKRLREAGGSLTLVIIAPRILRLFQITGLTKVLAIQPSVAEVITADPHWQHTAETESGSAPLWCQQHGQAFHDHEGSYAVSGDRSLRDHGNVTGNAASPSDPGGNG